MSNFVYVEIVLITLLITSWLYLPFNIKQLNSVHWKIYANMSTERYTVKPIDFIVSKFDYHILESFVIFCVLLNSRLA